MSGRIAAGLGVVSLLLFGTGIALYVATDGIPADRIFPFAILVVFSVVGGMIAARQPRNPIGWIFCGTALLSGLATLADAYASYWFAGEGGSEALGELAAWLEDLSWVPEVLVPLTFLLLLFPDGRLLTRRWRPVAWCAGLGIAGTYGFTGLQVRGLDDFPIQNPYGVDSALIDPLLAFFVVLLVVGVVGSPISLWLRFHRASSEERQQIKWLVWAGAIAAVTFAIGVPGMAVWDDAISNAAILASVLGIAVATGIAILRYRLYDIDVVIYRTLVYGVLTGTLAATYVGLVLLLQLVRGPESDLGVAASTLVVAGLFRPARLRIQALVDRRFYRHKYDAKLTLERFGARLREEVDLDALEGELRDVVAETMQPTHLSLWLRERA
jgi:hypothetical protein